MSENEHVDKSEAGDAGIDIPQHISLKDAAKRLGVSLSMLRNEVAAGRLEARKIGKGRGRYVVPITALTAFLDAATANARTGSGAGRRPIPLFAQGSQGAASKNPEAPSVLEEAGHPDEHLPPDEPVPIGAA